jgi:Xaa-Pro aminopeptidase
MRPTTPRAFLELAGCPAFLVTDLLNIRYLTGLPLSAGFLLATPRKWMLFVDARYSEAAEKSADATVRDIGDMAAVLNGVPECGFESEEVTVEKMASWKSKYKNTKFVRKTDVVQAFRRQKDDEELKLMRRAHKMTRELLRRIPSALRTQTSEEKLARQILIWALELGADGLSFDPIVAFGTHTSRPHHRPTPRLLKKGHIVQIDIGVRFKGYCADMSEVFFTVPATPLQKRIYKTLCEAKDKAMAAVQPGVTTHELDRIAREVLKREGIEDAFTHSLGHGIGLDVHEGPILTQKRPAQPLLAREIVTIEPGVYFPGRFGMRVEDMILVPDPPKPAKKR